jgi:hypothetical protein
MRKFETGATRNSEEGKLDFEGFLSPIVLERFAKYMDKHRIQADGNVRDSDNWQKLFGEEHLNVCMKSSWRHFFDWWKQHRGYKSNEDIEDSICALIFNANAYLFKLLKGGLEIDSSRKTQKATRMYEVRGERKD